MVPQGPATVCVQDARQTLSRLRGLEDELRSANEAGAQNGAQLYKVSQAERALSTELRTARPDFGALDHDYALLKGEDRAAYQQLNAIQQARGAALNKTVKGSTPNMSVPTRLAHLPGAMLDAMTGSPAKTARALLDYVVRPSASPDAIAALAPQAMPRATRAAIQGTISTLPASLHGLFSR
jgi:hypothetical protein